jgi:hypothetical protein
VVWFGYIAHLL